MPEMHDDEYNMKSSCHDSSPTFLSTTAWHGHARHFADTMTMTREIGRVTAMTTLKYKSLISNA